MSKEQSRKQSMEKLKTEALRKICHNEKEYMKLLTAICYTEHAQERFLVKQIANVATNPSGGKGDKSAIKGYTDAMEHDIPGSVQLMLVMAEIYRVLVNDGTLDPADPIAICERLGFAPSAAQKVIDLATAAMKEDGIEHLIGKDLLTIEKVSHFERGAADAKADDLVKEIIKVGMDNAKQCFNDMYNGKADIINDN